MVYPLEILHKNKKIQGFWQKFELPPTGFSTACIYGTNTQDFLSNFTKTNEDILIDYFDQFLNIDNTKHKLVL